MSTSPIGDHTQLCSAAPATFSYTRFPPRSTTRWSHSTLEKFTSHTSPARGGPPGPVNPAAPACRSNALQGIAISTLHPRSSSHGSFSVPSTRTAVLSPAQSHVLSPFPPARYGLRRNKSHTVFSAFTSNS